MKYLPLIACVILVAGAFALAEDDRPEEVPGDGSHIELPAVFSLKIGDQTIALEQGQEKSVTIGGKAYPVTIEPAAYRLIKIDGIQFRVAGDMKATRTIAHGEGKQTGTAYKFSKDKSLVIVLSLPVEVVPDQGAKIKEKYQTTFSRMAQEFGLEKTSETKLKLDADSGMSLTGVATVWAGRNNGKKVGLQIRRYDLLNGGRYINIFNVSGLIREDDQAGQQQFDQFEKVLLESLDFAE